VKIFGIGFHKTGTTSLAEALKILGYSVCGPVGIRNPNIAKEVYDIAFELVEQYDAFQDNPWAVIYKHLDEKYPGSKFILTKRPVEQWIESAVRHFGKKDTPMREWIYGIGHPIGHEEVYIERYQRHNREVQEYFKDRPDDFIVMNFPGDGWEKICGFLGKSIPKEEFPHANKSAQREQRPSFLTRLKKRVS
jgi:hypothetical protein